MALKLFITGTDTNVGKTYASTLLLKLFNQKYSTLGIKPIATGASRINGVLQNADALQLQANSSIQLEYAKINPYVFEQPIAPHIAAARAGIELTANAILNKLAYALNFPADIYVIEGVGGWEVPLNTQETMSSFVQAGKFSVILIISIKLGCLNHSILTYQAIRQAKLPIVGWVANIQSAAISMQNEMITYLKNFLKIPCLGTIDFNSKSIALKHGYDLEKFYRFLYANRTGNF